MEFIEAKQRYLPLPQPFGLWQVERLPTMPGDFQCYLLKQSGAKGAKVGQKPKLHLRWFQLKGTMLYYSHMPDTEQIIGVIPLEGATILTSGAKGAATAGAAEGGAEIQITHPSRRPFLLLANSASERDLYVSVLRRRTTGAFADEWARKLQSCSTILDESGAGAEEDEAADGSFNYEDDGAADADSPLNRSDESTGPQLFVEDGENLQQSFLHIDANASLNFGEASAQQPATRPAGSRSSREKPQRKVLKDGKGNLNAAPLVARSPQSLEDSEISVMVESSAKKASAAPLSFTSAPAPRPADLFHNSGAAAAAAKRPKKKASAIKKMLKRYRLPKKHLLPALLIAAIVAAAAVAGAWLRFGRPAALLEPVLRYGGEAPRPRLFRPSEARQRRVEEVSVPEAKAFVEEAMASAAHPHAEDADEPTAAPEPEPQARRVVVTAKAARRRRRRQCYLLNCV